MDYLAKNGYRVITMKRLAAFLEGNERAAAQVGRDHDRRRLPLDVRDRLPDPEARTGFRRRSTCTRDFVGAGDAMTWAQMKEMRRSGLIDIQPHSKTHSQPDAEARPRVRREYRERIRREVDAPINVIRERLGTGRFRTLFRTAT